MNQVIAAKIKEVMDLADKSPQIIRFKQQCLEIRAGQSRSISQKVIDDAFDAFGEIIKQASNDADERIELQKQIFKDFVCDTIRRDNIAIE